MDSLTRSDIADIWDSIAKKQRNLLFRHPDWMKERVIKTHAITAGAQVRAIDSLETTQFHRHTDYHTARQAREQAALKRSRRKL